MGTELGPSPFFTRHAAAYAASPRHARGADLERMVSALSVAPGETALDVATGTGHTAIALALAGAEVTGLDPTPAMLAEGRRLAEERGVSIRWLQAAVEGMPFPAGSFDIVTCRRAAHHFSDVAGAVEAMARLLRPGGRFACSDICPPEDCEAAYNRLERMRDPTHVHALTESEWRAALKRAGLLPTSFELECEEGTLASWLSPVAADGPEARAIAAELAALDPAVSLAITGGRDGGWRKQRVVFVAAAGSAAAPRGSGARAHPPA